MTAAALAWLDRLIWSLIYAGLILVILGFATHEQHLIAGWSLGVVGTLVTAAGCVLIWIRSRMREDSADGAQSPPRKQGPP
ncbi:MAG TPA: hypothetical protein VHA82_07440 [Ramlibacter sp.]|uniref:hypothetical protein n=1 Tax=Ramlibacter sp. TaxID=1917967 RepID=UPI002B6823A3|nr:hypothetical protein [Ramlibacter sp.]HVZ43628.1 hypothetical protein [Ramlibacter sp.]